VVVCSREHSEARKAWQPRAAGQRHSPAALMRHFPHLTSQTLHLSDSFPEYKHADIIAPRPQSIPEQAVALILK
jgi:hypothetical protein